MSIAFGPELIGDAGRMRIAVTGATGNVGTSLLRTLKTRLPDANTVGLSRRTPPPVHPYDDTEWHRVDLGSDRSAAELRRALAGVDVVVHLAIAFQPMRDREYLRSVNVGGTERVLSAAADAGVSHIVHLSSGGVYAPGAYGRPVDESWDRTGVPSSTYSCDKAAAEFAVDRFESLHPDIAVARLRPGLIGQYRFGSALLRYALPDLVPSWVAGHVPLLPIDRRFAVPAVHTDDVSDAIVRAIERRASGPFNLGAPTAVRADDVARSLGSRIVPTPSRALSMAARAAFAAHLSAVHHGWIDLAFSTPMLDTTRAQSELEWTGSMDGPQVLDETVRGIRDGAFGSSSPLRERNTMDRITSFARRGFVGRGRAS